jgi:hypothetical protein
MQQITNPILHGVCQRSVSTTFVDRKFGDKHFPGAYKSMSNSVSHSPSKHKFDDIGVTNKPMLLRKSTTECVIAVDCGQANNFSYFPSQFSLSSVKDRFQRRGIEQQENISPLSIPTSGVSTINDAEFRKLKEQLRRTGMRSTNGVRQVLFCPSSPM